MIRRPDSLKRVLETCTRRPWPVLASWLALVALAGFGVARLEIETSTDSVLDRRAEAWQFYQRSLERFGGDEVVVVALPGEGAFPEEIIGSLESIDAKLSEIPGVRRVDSLASVPFVDVSSDGTLELDPFVLPAGNGGLEVRLRRSMEIDRIAPRTLISKDGRVVALNVVLESDLPIEFETIVSRIRKSVEGRRAWISGVPVFRTEINTRTGAEITVFIAGTIAVVVLLMAIWFRSLTAAGVALASGAVGSWILAASMGALAQPMMLATMILPSLMLALGCAYSMHLLAHGRGPLTPDQLAARLEEVAFPIVISGLTTTAGFLGIAAVRIDAVRAVGIFGAIGVLAVMAFALTGAPALLALRSLPAPSGQSRRQAALTAGALVRLVRRHRLIVFGGWIAVVMASVHGLRLLHVETDAVLWFTKGSDIRRDYAAIRTSLSGISPVNVVVESSDGEPVTRPDTVRALDRLSGHLERHPDVGRAISVADPLRQIHGAFLEDATQPLPPSHAAIEQYLLLLESVPHLNDLLAADRSAANVQLRVNNNGSQHLLAVAREAEGWWRDHGAPGTRARATGIMYEFARAQHEISQGQIRGLAIAVFCIAGILLFVYRSPGIVAMALVSNVVPILMVFGVMGLLGVPLDAGTVVIGSLALGIAVDDTVHLLTAFRDEQLAGGDLERSLQGALERVLVPLAYTTIVIALGFGILGLSDFTFTRNLGVLTAGIMVTCFVADVVLLPALLIAGARPRLRRGSRTG